MSNNVVYGITIKADGSAEVVKGAEKIRAAFGDIEHGTSAAAAGADKLSSAIARVGHYGAAFLGVTAFVEYTRQVVQAADAYTGLQARLRLATTSQQEFNTANAALFDIAQRNGVPLAETLSLYSKLSPALRELGGTQQQTLQMADLVGKSLRLSGADAVQSSAAMLQLAQALGSGVLRGDEFNSLMENSPRLMKAVADGMHQPIGALRKMAEEGQLTADKVANALLSQKGVLESEYRQLPLTVSAAWTKLGNAVTQEIGRLDSASGGTRNLAAAIGSLADNMGALEGAAVAAAQTGVALLAASFVAARTEAIAAAGVAGLGMLRNAVAGLILLYESGGVAALARGIMGIGATSAAATPPALTLGGALKALVWPAALLYGLYEFASYAEKTFVGVRIGIVALIEQFQLAGAYLSHPFDTKAREKSIAEIKVQNSAIVEMLGNESLSNGRAQTVVADSPLKSMMQPDTKTTKKADPNQTALDSLRVEAFKKEMEAMGQTAAQIKVLEMARSGATQTQLIQAVAQQETIDRLESEKRAREKLAKTTDKAAKEAAALKTAQQESLSRVQGSYARENVDFVAQQGVDKVAGLDGNARIEAQRANAVAEEEARFAAKQEAIAKETQQMSDKGVLTEEIVQTQARRMEMLEETHQNRLDSIKKQHLTRREQFEAMSWKDQVSTVASEMERMTSVGATKSRAMFEINKAAAKANAVVSGATSVMKAWEMGPIIGPVLAALSIANTAAQLAAINSATFGGGAATAASVGASGGIPSQMPQTSSPVSMQSGASSGQSTAPALSLSLTIQALDPSTITDETYRKISDKLTPMIQQVYDRGGQVSMVMS